MTKKVHEIHSQDLQDFIGGQRWWIGKYLQGLHQNEKFRVSDDSSLSSFKYLVNHHYKRDTDDIVDHSLRLSSSVISQI